jgi:hypothetical protein
MITIPKQPMDMTSREIDFISSNINAGDTVLEYGAGASTLYFSKYAKHYYSIEHVKEWYESVSSQVDINTKIFHAPCFFINSNTHCDYSNDHKIKWAPYFKKVHELPCSKYNKILIDGRARAYCALEVFNFLDNEGLLMIHDYSFRSKYHEIVESMYSKINTIDSLGIFKKNKI